MKQFGHTSEFKDGKSQRSYTHATTCHVGAMIEGVMREAYRVHRVGNEIHVSDMLDEGHWFAPTIERTPVTRNPHTVVAFLGLKYERKLREELGLPI